MTIIEPVHPWQRLDRLLSECFSGGDTRQRELRLTAEEVGYVQRSYPGAQVRHMAGRWYEISFREALNHG